MYCNFFLFILNVFIYFYYTICITLSIEFSTPFFSPFIHRKQNKEEEEEEEEELKGEKFLFAQLSFFNDSRRRIQNETRTEWERTHDFLYRVTKIK